MSKDADNGKEAVGASQNSHSSSKNGQLLIDVFTHREEGQHQDFRCCYLNLFEAWSPGYPESSGHLELLSHEEARC